VAKAPLPACCSVSDDITDGHIRIDGQDIRTVAQNSLRQQTRGGAAGVTAPFNDTLYYNLAYGRPDTRATVIAAARFCPAGSLYRQPARRL
jgi:ATP-binding cassette subfamily B protein